MILGRISIKRAFTLVEIMIVIAIIGILSATLYPSFFVYMTRARDTQRVADIGIINTAIQSFSIEKDALPAVELSGCYPFVALSGNFISKEARSPKGDSYNEGCGMNGYYGYGASASGATNMGDFVLMAYMENMQYGNYTGSLIGMTGTLSPYGSWNVRHNTIKGAGHYYIIGNSGYNNNSTGTVAPVDISPVAGGWSAWTAWDSCTVTCGGGTQSRTHYCNNPTPANGGPYCTGSASESQACNTTPCPVTVTFDANGGAGHTPTTKSIVPGAPVGALPTNPTRAGYVFNGWYTATIGGTQVTMGTIISSVETFYAQWSLTANWEVGTWGACSASPTWVVTSGWSTCSDILAGSCGGGTQTRTRACQNTTGTQTRTIICRLGDGSIGADSYCEVFSPKPSASQACSGTCSGSATESQSCARECYGRWQHSGGYTSCNGLGNNAIRCYNGTNCNVGFGNTCGYYHNGVSTTWWPSGVAQTITCRVYTNSSCTNLRP